MNDDLTVVEDAPVAAAEPEVETTDPVTVPQVGTLTVKRSGAETDVVFPINPPATIGRFDPSVGPIDVDLAGLPEGAYVSRKHAKITFEDGSWMIHDLGSSNGTFVLQDGDFAKVEIAELSTGDEIALGNARFVFRIGTSTV